MHDKEFTTLNQFFTESLHLTTQFRSHYTSFHVY